MVETANNTLYDFIYADYTLIDMLSIIIFTFM
jgi:hypothetical protein